MEGTKNQIHCKLTYNDQIRRFIFYGHEFSELRDHIANLVGLPPDSFVLKYIDNENDRITVSSNDDLVLALSLSDKLLRLVVESPQTMPIQSPPCHFPGVTPMQYTPQPYPHQHYPPQQQYPQQPVSGYGRGQHFHHGGRGGGGQGHWQGREIAKTRVLSKIEMLKQNLAQMPPEEQSYRKQHIQMKIHHMEGKLLRFDAMQERKAVKHQHKMEKKWDKKLDPQTLNQIEVIKGQVASLKFNMSQIKAQKKAKKDELQLCLQSGTGDKEAIWKEILTLKEAGHEVGKQIAVLKDQIRALRGF